MAAIRRSGMREMPVICCIGYLLLGLSNLVDAAAFLEDALPLRVMSVLPAPPNIGGKADSEPEPTELSGRAALTGSLRGNTSVTFGCPRRACA